MEKNRSKQAKHAYEKLRKIIISGEKLPGVRLIPASLENEIGVGRGPIREALLELGQMGLVLIEPYKGAIVAYPPTFEEIEEIFEIRYLLEGKAAEASVPKFTDELISEMEKLHKKMCSVPKAAESYFELNRQFHMTLYRPSEREVLLALIRQLIYKVQTFRIRYPFEQSDYQRFNKEHQEIIDSLRACDEEAVKMRTVANIRSGFETLVKVHGKIIPMQKY